ncbi:AAA family ATPase [Mariniblastus fucicola]|uniref:Recombination protein F n=1 Tax=Mariniblastus fucicola TaxID=980251 RepID=A0A5B9PE90_9BACT|nr:AAA family ATPase [Mariniblastus fucicola]QEG24728.1 recombination protein F [Mariniblastus fucicola]
MSEPNLDRDAAFLRGVYLRENFDFGARSSAIPEPPAEEVEPAQPSRDADDTLFMTDDEFIKSITTLSDSDVLPRASISPTGVQESTSLDPFASPESELLPSDPRIEKVARKDRFPFSISWVKDLELEFKTAVTFLVGENGSGKSTLIEAIASLAGYPVCGGGHNDVASSFGPERHSELAQAMYPHFKKRPRDGYFFRAEFYAQFASLLDRRQRDPDFKGDPYKRYGGQSPHTRSHGESFLDLINHRIGSGLYLMDEPESALSPQRQLSLLAAMAKSVKSGKTQFIIATHSPILMTFPGATILGLDSDSIAETTLEETTHFQLTRGILEFPEKYWRHLTEDASENSAGDDHQ